MIKINDSCCIKILPLTYNDSLSYYEQLCKLTAKMNEIIDAVNGEISEKLQAYIDEKFDNLMINAIYDEKTETIILEKGVKNE